MILGVEQYCPQTWSIDLNLDGNAASHRVEEGAAFRSSDADFDFACVEHQLGQWSLTDHAGRSARSGLVLSAGQLESARLHGVDGDLPVLVHLL